MNLEKYHKIKNASFKTLGNIPLPRGHVDTTLVSSQMESLHASRMHSLPV